MFRHQGLDTKVIETKGYRNQGLDTKVIYTKVI